MTDAYVTKPPKYGEIWGNPHIRIFIMKNAWCGNGNNVFLKPDTLMDNKKCFLHGNKVFP